MIEPCLHEFMEGSDFCAKCGESREAISAGRAHLGRGDARTTDDAAGGESRDTGGSPADRSPPPPGSGAKSIAAILDEFKGRSSGYEPVVVGVFGPPKAGKSFLNQRLEQVWAAQDPQRRVNPIHVVPSTNRGEFTLREFTAPPKAVMVVDLPGEEFKDSAGLEEDADLPYRPNAEDAETTSNMRQVLERADALILYISAQDIAPGAQFSESHFEGLPTSSKQTLYVRFLKAALSVGAPPVFIAVSQADRLDDAHVADVDAWLHISREAPGLATYLLHRWKRFSCGYVASHVGGGWTILSFAPVQGEMEKTKLGAELEAVLQSVPDVTPELAAFARTCLAIQEEVRGRKSGDRQTARTLADTRRAFLDRLGAGSDRTQTYDDFCVTALKLSADEGKELGLRSLHDGLAARNVKCEMVPRAMPSRPSFGVQDMFDRVFAMLREGGRTAPDLSVQRRKAASFGNLDKPPLRWRSGAAMLSKPSRIAALCALLVALAVVPPLVLWLAAVSDAAGERERLRARVADSDGLPRGFALEIGAVWRLDENRLEGIRARMQTEPSLVSLAQDALVRAPNIDAAPEVNEHGVAFEALKPDPRAAAILRTITCTGGARCSYNAGAAAPQGEPASRSESYARALRTYWSRGTARTLQPELLEFLRRLNNTWRFVPSPPETDLTPFLPYLGAAWPSSIKGEAPVKQILMPLLAVKLIDAHVELRERLQPLRLPKDQVAMQDAVRRYGERLVAVLEGYRRAFDALPPAANRRPSDIRAELRTAGVHLATLAVHLLEVALVKSESWASFRIESESLLKPVDLGLLDFEKAVNVTEFAADYPDLLCLYRHLRRTAGESQPDPAGEACRRTRAAADAPFGRERRLTDPNHWLEPPQRRDAIEYDDYVGPIREAAARWLTRTVDQEERRQLRVLAELPDPLEWKHLLLTSYWGWLVAWALALTAGAGGFARLLRARHDVSLIVVPYRRDRAGTGRQADA